MFHNMSSLDVRIRFGECEKCKKSKFIIKHVTDAFLNIDYIICRRCGKVMAVDIESRGQDPAFVYGRIPVKGKMQERISWEDIL